MINQPTLIGIVCAIPLGIVYIAFTLRRGGKPDLSEFATIFLSVVGAVVGIDFGVRAVWIDLDLVPQLKDQRLPMVLGAIAVTWIAIEQIGKSLLHLLRTQPPSAAKSLGAPQGVNQIRDATP